MQYVESQPDKLMARLNKAKTDRQNWNALWQECSDYIMPRRGDFQRKTTPGGKRNRFIYDSTALEAAEKLSSALQGYLSSSTEKWFFLTPQEADVESPEIRAWLQDCADVLYKVMASPNANFYPQSEEFYADLVCFGSAVMIVEEYSEGFPIRFYTIPLSQCYFCENEMGLVDSIFREFNFTIRNTLNRFGDSIKDSEVLKELERMMDKNPDQEITLTHSVYSKSSYREKPGTFPFASVYMWGEKKAILKEGGFYESPYVVGRWKKLPGETYGRGPGVIALPDVKMLNAMCKTNIEGAQKSVNPPLQVPDDGFVNPINVSPGAVNYVRKSYTNDGDAIRPIQFGAQIQIGIAMEDQRRAAIQRMFMIDMLQDDKRAEMSATEAMQREQARMKIMAPQLGRLHSEFFGPLITRVFSILKRMGVLPAPPDEFKGREIKIEYVSPLAKAQKMVEVSQIQQGIQMLAPLIQLDPTVIDDLNPRAIVKRIAELSNLPHQAIRTEEEVKQIRDERAQAQQAQQNSQMTLQDTQAMKNVGDLLQQAQGAPA